ncbi:MAG: hypothetical protein Q9M92_07430 [Enterobacterales bacterium]|nr:hypothetical protein [Enterobacterales bacterium]
MKCTNKYASELDEVNEISMAIGAARSFAYMMATKDYDSFNQEIKSFYAAGLENLLGKIKKDFDSYVLK